MREHSCVGTAPNTAVTPMLEQAQVPVLVSATWFKAVDPSQARGLGLMPHGLDAIFATMLLRPLTPLETARWTSSARYATEAI